MNSRISSLSICGLKSLRSVNDLVLRPMNVLIGPNGAGKSNFISLFRLLSFVYTGDGLQYFVSQQGSANALLHYGAAVTREIEFHLCFDTDTGKNEYHVRLTYAVSDTLFYSTERYRYVPTGAQPGSWVDLGHGHTEPRLREKADENDKTARFILQLLRQCKLYQFHNTSSTAGMRQHWGVADNRSLREDGSNVAAILFVLREKWPVYYQRIESVLRIVFPQFAEFVLESEGQNIYLRWRERGSDYIFGAFQISDGTLRLIGLLTLLMQPVERLPKVILLDEPELGLHPAAIRLIADLLNAVSEDTQILIATQSPTLLDYFTAEDILVADRNGKETTVRRLSDVDLEKWLEEYSLSELWEKNILGGKPT